jgi:hypothetical protein
MLLPLPRVHLRFSRQGHLQVFLRLLQSHIHPTRTHRATNLNRLIQPNILHHKLEIGSRAPLARAIRVIETTETTEIDATTATRAAGISSPAGVTTDLNAIVIVDFRVPTRAHHPILASGRPGLRARRRMTL